jgi:heme-degrading monooxygenase HmoA
MPFVSVTRLRVRALRFLPAFFLQAMRTRSQVAAAPGFLAGSLLPDRRWTFWTLTLWDDAASMRAYMTAGAHRIAMPKLMHWCDEASVVHWDQAVAALPTWPEAKARMRSEGRPSKVRHPTADHLAMTFAPARTSNATPITPKDS